MQKAKAEFKSGVKMRNEDEINRVLYPEDAKLIRIPTICLFDEDRKEILDVLLGKNKKEEYLGWLEKEGYITFEDGNIKLTEDGRRLLEILK